MTSPGYLRYPHIHSDLIVFASDDDIWLAPADGGRAWRLSADHAQVSYPRFSHDGARIAWTSWRDGNPEVYTADAEGNDAGRLTYWSDARTRVTGWTEAGEVLAVSATGQPETYLTWAYAVPLEGTPPRRLPFGPVVDLALAPAGTALLSGRMNNEMAYWKRYRGGTRGKLWTATDQDPLFTRVLADLDGQFNAPMLIAGRLFFLSDHEGTGNIYSCALDGTGITRHTDHDGQYARNPSTDGQRIVYHVAGDIWVLDGLDAPEPRRLEITLGSPAVGRAPKLISAKDHLGSLDTDQTGQASVVEVRGTVHWLTHKDGPARALYVDPAARARLPRVLGETGQVVWVTDAAGDDAIEIASVSDEPEAETVRLAEGHLGHVLSLVASPDGATVAAAAHDGRLLAVDVTSGQVTELAASDDGAIEGLSWSPDSAWLAWSQPSTPPLRRIRMARIADHEVIDVTDGRFTDTDPVFSLDGLYLAFVSRRSFDPVYDAQTFDLSFPFGSRPYLVPLAAQTPSPFGPLPGGRPVGQDPPEPDKDTTDSPERTEVSVDAEGLVGRVVGVPVIEARYSGLRAIKGGLAWLREPVAGVLGEGNASPEDDAPRPTLERFDLRKREVTELVGELDWFDVSGDGTRLVVSDRDDLRVLPSEHKEDHGSGESVSVDESRARFQADPAALWRHAFDEARLMRRNFWTPDMSGVDWDGVLDTYRPLLDRVRSADDFADLMWEVVAELGTSHSYIGKAGAVPDFLASSHRGRRPARRGPVSRLLRPLAGGPGAAGRVVRPAGALTARGARRGGPGRGRAGRGGRAAGRPGARPGAAAGRDGRQAGRAHHPATGRRSGSPPPGGGRAAARRAAAAVPGLGARPAPPGARARRRTARLPAHPEHDRRGLGRLPPRPAHRDAVRRPGHGRARERRRAHLPAGGGEAGPPRDRLGPGTLDPAGLLPRGRAARPGRHRG